MFMFNYNLQVEENLDDDLIWKKSIIFILLYIFILLSVIRNKAKESYFHLIFVKTGHL